MVTVPDEFPDFSGISSALSGGNPILSIPVNWERASTAGHGSAVATIRAFDAHRSISSDVRCLSELKPNKVRRLIERIRDYG